jgi:hypothetical protein
MVDEEESKSSCLQKFPRCDSPIVDSIVRDFTMFKAQDSPPTLDPDTLTGKPRSFSHVLYHSLTSMEKNVFSRSLARVYILVYLFRLLR